MGEDLVTVNHEAVGLETVGNLELMVGWRAPARQASFSDRPWHHDAIGLPLAEIEVRPSRVLYWDCQPNHLNSPKRFQHMLGLRAWPKTVVGGNSLANLHQLVEDESEMEMTGYKASRAQIVELTDRFFEEYPGHIHRANIRMIFRYQAPVDKAACLAIRGFLNHSQQGTFF